MSEDEFRTELEWPSDPFGDPPEPMPERAPRPEVVPDGDPSPASPAPAVRDDVAERLLERLDRLRSVTEAQLAEVRAEQAALRRTVQELLDQPAPRPPRVAAPALEPVLAELAQLREELVSLRRRISLRASAQPGGAVLSDEQLARLARTVADLLSGGPPRKRP